MYYQGFEKKFPSGSKYWTAYDDQLVGLLFSKIVNRSQHPAQNPTQAHEDAVEEMVNNLFDLCFYINKDFHDC